MRLWFTISICNSHETYDAHTTTLDYAAQQCAEKLLLSGGSELQLRHNTPAAVGASAPEEVLTFSTA
jgi:hypothetical protein